MTVQVTVEFTDAQWVLVQSHFINQVLNEVEMPVHRDITEEELSAKMFNWVKCEVEVCIEANAIAEAKQSMVECFEV